MKVIFLDIDGVLNYRNMFVGSHYTGNEINEDKVKLLKILVDATNVNIVLSSSWRILRFSDIGSESLEQFYRLTDYLKKYDMYIYDYTESLIGNRGSEIKKYVESHDVSKFVILDDDADMGDYMSTNLVQTSYYKTGLEYEHIERAIKMLNGE